MGRDMGAPSKKKKTLSPLYEYRGPRA